MERLISFSDAVVAIAITLLVLPLVEDASAGQVDSFDELVDTSGQQFLLFVLSFVVICRFWLVHHRLFREVRAFDAWVFWLNALWLLSIVVLPFATEVLGNADDSGAVTNALYIGTMFVTTCAGLALRWAVLRSPGLQRERERAGADDDPEATSLLDGTVAVAVMGAALVVAVALPAVGLWGLLLLATSGPVTHALRGRTGRGSRSGGARTPLP